MAPITPRIQTNDEGSQIADTVVKVGDHGRSIDNLTQRIAELEGRFINNEKTAATMCEVVEGQMRMQTILATTFTNLLKNDVNIKNAVIDLVQNADRNYLIASLKRFGTVIIGLILLACGAILQAGIAKFIDAKPLENPAAQSNLNALSPR